MKFLPSSALFLAKSARSMSGFGGVSKGCGGIIELPDAKTGTWDKALVWSKSDIFTFPHLPSSHPQFSIHIKKMQKLHCQNLITTASNKIKFNNVCSKILILARTCRRNEKCTSRFPSPRIYFQLPASGRIRLIPLSVSPRTPRFTGVRKVGSLSPCAMANDAIIEYQS